MEDRKPAARPASSLLIDLTVAESPTSIINAIDLTRDAIFVDLIESSSRKRGLDHSENNNNKNKRARRQTPIDCSICLETVEAFQGYSLVACGHSFCRSCLHGYIESKLANKDIQKLTCPDLTCHSNLDTFDVRACTLELGDATCWQSFQELATECFLDTAMASKDTTIRRCPTNHCNFTFLFEAPGNNDDTQQQGQLFICPECDEAYCLRCPAVQGRVGPAHDDACYKVMEEIRKSEERKLKLEEWKRDNAQADARFQELLRKEGASRKTKPCPKCHTPITKNGGCSHMLCSRCGTSFCWTSVKGNY